MSAVTLWNEYYNEYCKIPSPRSTAAPPPDLLDFSFSVDHLRLEVANLVRLLQHADAADCERGPVLRAHLPDLRQIRDEAAALVAEAEAA